MRHERNHIPEIAILEIMEEPKIIQIGSYSPTSACNAKVLDADGICPTLLDHKGAEPAILTPIRTEKAKELRRQGIETFANRELVPRLDGCSGTITTVQKDNLLQEPCILGYTRDNKGNVQSYHEKDVAGTIHTSSGSGGNTDQFVQEQVIGSMQANAMRGSIDGVSPCLTEAMGMGGGQIPMITEQEPCGCYDNQSGEFAREPLEGTARTLKSDHHNAVMLRCRIRKLTPTECFRLQGVDDSDIEKLKSAKLTQTLKNGKVKEKPIPKTQLYKMAGNSIVVDVLYCIFRNMFIPEYQSKKPIQKSLFDLL